MPQQPTQGGGQNQTLLELILALKGLAQTIEFYHQNLSRKLDEEAKARLREIDKLRELIQKNTQAINVAPITFSDRAEKLMNNLRNDINEKLRDVDDAVTEVRNKLEGYSRTAERAISQNESTHEAEEKAALVQKTDEKADITGRIEVTEGGEVKVQFNSKMLRRIWHAVLIAAAGGGLFGLKEAIQYLLGSGN